MALPDSAASPQDCAFLVLSSAASCSLVQFPFSKATYFCYVAPLVLLSVVAVLSVVPKPSPGLVAGVYLFCFLYMVFDVTPGFLYQMGKKYSRNKQTAPLNIDRSGGLRVLPGLAVEYKALTTLIAAHVSGDYIYATPDCPEVYFLAGRRNPTRTLFDFMDDPEDRTQRILDAIQSHEVSLVVFDRDPKFSGPVPPDLRAALEQRFPASAKTNLFEVRWKP